MTLFEYLLPIPQSPDQILILAAVIPAAILMLLIYRADRLDKEPPGVLALLLLFGLIATVLSIIAEMLGTSLLTSVLPTEDGLFRILLNFAVIALSEEGFKYLLLKHRTWKSPHFNCQFDGVVYAVFISLGFAVSENICYVISYGLGTALLRAVTAVPGHACFGVFMGAWYGLARSQENKGRTEQSRTALRLAVVCPVLLHGLYDLLADLKEDGLSLWFVGFVIAMFIGSFVMIRRLSSSDRYI